MFDPNLERTHNRYCQGPETIPALEKPTDSKFSKGYVGNGDPSQITRLFYEATLPTLMAFAENIADFLP